ncbi:MAG: hypothetical protein AB7G93_20295 [Bdellovibrionales bacterium]
MALRSGEIEPHVPKGLVFAAGVMGGLLMTVTVAVAQAADLTAMNLGRLVGTLFTGAPSLGTWWLGAGVHLFISGLVALVYEAAFRALGHSGIWMGALLGVVHWILSGLFLGVLPSIHPAVPEIVPAPGMFAIQLNLFSMLLFFLLHVVYGAVVGGIYHMAAVESQAQIRRVVMT